MTNPLIDLADLPDYPAIEPAHVEPALTRLLAAAETALVRVTSSADDWDYDRLALVLDVPLEQLTRAWGAVSHLNAVADTPAMRDAYNAALPRMVAFFTRLGSDERLFERYKALALPDALGALAPARQRALALSLRGFVLSGAELSAPDKLRFAEVQELLAQASQRYSENVLDATDGYGLLVDESRLAGVPEDVVRSAREAAAADGAAGCKLTLQAPCLQPVMQYVRDRDLRETLYRANATRASEFGPTERDNGPLMQQLLELRAEEAALLGYPHYTALSLVPKMARNAEEVASFLRDLARRARPGAERELSLLRSHAAAELDIGSLAPWDIGFVGEHLKQSLYAFNDQEVKQYFALPRVLDGLFDIVRTLFGVTIREDHAPVWHPTAQLYRIERAGTGDAAPELVGRFYLDPYARPGKRQGAWMDGVCSRWRRPDAVGMVQKPVAQLVCNFAAPVGERPALLTHDDVITLFHEFGHALHHLLTQVDEPSVAGTAGVEWDAVELPSQFMENFCWEWAVLSRLSAHVDTGQPLPRELFDRMRSARNFLGGLALMRQIEYALLDLRLHTEPGAANRVQQMVQEVRNVVALIQPPEQARPQHTFTHIFSGGYSAGYYSYLWAEVLSADAFAAFEEMGLLDPATGARFRREVLEAGGARPAMDSFRAFRGREPTIDALLRHLGLAAGDPPPVPGQAA
ncbi:MAG: M3 family metallopeptidase [Aquabacterium sp.]